MSSNLRNEALKRTSVELSYKAVRVKDALRICNEIILAREEFTGEYTFWRRLKTDDSKSKKIDTCPCKATKCTASHGYIDRDPD